MNLEWETYAYHCAYASVGNLLGLRVRKVAGEYVADVENMDGQIIEQQSGIHFQAIAADIAVAMAHRILRDLVLGLEGRKSEPIVNCETCGRETFARLAPTTAPGHNEKELPR